MEILENYGGWPAVKGDQWNSETWDWIDINKQMSNDGVENALIFSLTILTDQKNSTKRVIDVSHGINHLHDTC